MDGHYTIVLADGHVRFRRELRRILEEHPGFEVSGEASNRQELFDILKQAPPAMVILDISMPDLRAGEGTRHIKINYPEVKVLITVMDQDPEYLSHGLAAGAEGVLPKQYVAGQIFRAIAVIRQGKVYIPPWISRDSQSALKDLTRVGQFGSESC